MLSTCRSIKKLIYNKDVKISAADYPNLILQINWQISRIVCGRGGSILQLVHPKNFFGSKLKRNCT